MAWQLLLITHSWLHGHITPFIQEDALWDLLGKMPREVTLKRWWKSPIKRRDFFFLYWLFILFFPLWHVMEVKSILRSFLERCLYGYCETCCFELGLAGKRSEMRGELQFLGRPHGDYAESYWLVTTTDISVLLTATGARRIGETPSSCSILLAPLLTKLMSQLLMQKKRCKVQLPC